MTVDLLGRLIPRKVLASWTDEHLLCPEHRGCRVGLLRSARLYRRALSSFAFCNGEVLFLLRAVDYTTQPERAKQLSQRVAKAKVVKAKAQHKKLYIMVAK